MPPRLKGSQGFTLIELLIVIAIIGALSAVTFASFTSARNRARYAQTVSDMREISTAASIFFNNNGYYPPWGANNVNPGLPLTAWPTAPCPGWFYVWNHGSPALPSDVARVTLRDNGGNFRYYYCVDQGTAPNCLLMPSWPYPDTAKDIITVASKSLSC